MKETSRWLRGSTNPFPPNLVPRVSLPFYVKRRQRETLGTRLFPSLESRLKVLLVRVETVFQHLLPLRKYVPFILFPLGSHTDFTHSKEFVFSSARFSMLNSVNITLDECKSKGRGKGRVALLPLPPPPHFVTPPTPGSSTTSSNMATRFNRLQISWSLRLKTQITACKQANCQMSLLVNGSH